jgi:hypothetical protein
LPAECLAPSDVLREAIAYLLEVGIALDEVL